MLGRKILIMAGLKVRYRCLPAKPLFLADRQRVCHCVDHEHTATIPSVAKEGKPLIDETSSKYTPGFVRKEADFQLLNLTIKLGNTEKVVSMLPNIKC